MAEAWKHSPHLMSLRVQLLPQTHLLPQTPLFPQTRLLPQISLNRNFLLPSDTRAVAAGGLGRSKAASGDPSDTELSSSGRKPRNLLAEAEAPQVCPHSLPHPPRDLDISQWLDCGRPPLQNTLAGQPENASPADTPILRTVDVCQGPFSWLGTSPLIQSGVVWSPVAETTSNSRADY